MLLSNNLNFKNYFNRNINISPLISKIYNIFSNDNVEEVSLDMICDYTSYEHKTNTLYNYSFNGVTCINDGIVTRIEQVDKNQCNIYIQDNNGYIYCYKNVESAEVNIYSFIKNGMILGRSTYNNLDDCYFFEVEIVKDGEYYDLKKII